MGIYLSVRRPFWYEQGGHFFTLVVLVSVEKGKHRCSQITKGNRNFNNLRFENNESTNLISKCHINTMKKIKVLRPLILLDFRTKYPLFELLADNLNWLLFSHFSSIYSSYYSKTLSYLCLPTVIMWSVLIMEKVPRLTAKDYTFDPTIYIPHIGQR